MKLRLQYIFTAILLAVLLPSGFYAAHAQDAPSFVSDSYNPHSDPDRPIYAPGGETEPGSGGGNSVKTVAGPGKDSVTAVSTPSQPQRIIRTPGENVKPSQVNKEEKEDESMLSFNFLYYIIRKYKLQDIVD